MHHYIALAWQPEDPQVSHRARELIDILRHSDSAWDRLIDTQGLAVASRPSVDQAMRSYTFPGNSGVIVGRLFSRASMSAVRELETLAPDLNVATKAERLAREYWGAYVAFLHSESDAETLILRDCSGRIPCYCVCFNGLHIFFSSIQDIAPFGIPFTINRNYLAGFILHQPLHIRATGLNEVQELLAGDGVSVSTAGMRQYSVWNPRTVTTSSVIDDYDRARSLLTSTTEDVIRAWASVYDRILLNISGGLDSAIVLACLKHLNVTGRVVCVNQYTDGSADDERSYARIACRQAGVALEEVPSVCDGRAFAETLGAIPPDPKPDIPKTFRMLQLKRISSLADRHACSTVWTGQGGDHIFLQVRNPYAAADYLLQHAFSRRFLKHVYDAAVLSRESVWSVMALAVRHKFGKAPVPAAFWTSGRPLVSQSLVDGFPEIVASLPWHLGSPLLSPGKQIQVDLLSDLLNRHKPINMIERPFEQHPLISQPLMELSLRIPTYQLLRGGRQRAMARDAFADCVPTAIVRREDKGCIKDQMRALIRGSAQLLHEKLLDGILVSLGIVDRARLEGILLHQDTYTATEEFALFACIAAEAWAEHWTPNATLIAAAQMKVSARTH